MCEAKLKHFTLKSFSRWMCPLRLNFSNYKIDFLASFSVFHVWYLLEIALEKSNKTKLDEPSKNEGYSYTQSH